MPTVKTVSVSYGRKFNLGDYESASFDATIWADIEEGEDLDEAMTRLWLMAKANVKAAAVPVVRKESNGSLSVEEAFMGLPIEVDRNPTEQTRKPYSREDAAAETKEG